MGVVIPVPYLEPVDENGWLLTPDDAAKHIVKELLWDLPKDRRVKVEQAIARWGTKWGDVVANAWVADDR